MHITFFIGNGFDLNLGLKTRYKDFYKYFKENAEESNMIKNWINEDDIFWSDLEQALGKSLIHVKENNLEKFYDDKDEMDDLLVEYLKKEQDKYIYDETNIKKQLIYSLDNLDANLSKDEKMLIENLKEKYGNTNLIYNFVSFNYTNCLDKIVEIQKSESSIISQHSYGANGYNTMSQLGEIYHIHGTVNEEMILGVNDESQIHNIWLKGNDEFYDNIIKVRMNEMIGQQKTADVKNVINRSRIICLFGMSIGETDKIWWEEIVDWMKKDKENLLILFWRDDKKLNENKLPGRTIRNNRKIKRKFLKKGNAENIDDELLKSIMSRIFISYNSKDIFRFPQYEEAEKENTKDGVLTKKKKNNYY